MAQYKSLRSTIWHATLAKNLVGNFARGNAPYAICVNTLFQKANLYVNCFCFVLILVWRPGEQFFGHVGTEPPIPGYY